MFLMILGACRQQGRGGRAFIRKQSAVKSTGERWARRALLRQGGARSMGEACFVGKREKGHCRKLWLVALMALIKVRISSVRQHVHRALIRECNYPYAVSCELCPSICRQMSNHALNGASSCSTLACGCSTSMVEAFVIDATHGLLSL